MIIDDYESIRQAHAKIFSPETFIQPIIEVLSDDERTNALSELTDEEIMDLLAAICELIN